MKSINRCKATNQGDRCLEERGHSEEKPHRSSFAIWTDAAGVMGRAIGSFNRYPRNRVANAAVEQLREINLKVVDEERKNIVSKLDALLRFFKGNKIAGDTK